MPLSDQDRKDLARARELLESTSLAARITDFVGKPVEIGLRMLPSKAQSALQDATKTALQRALGVALRTMAKERGGPSRDRLHSLAAATSGFMGGFFGLSGAAVELPFTTVIMLRSIGDIARSEGHDLSDPLVRLSCLEVFALGGPQPDDDAAETGYFAVRAAMSKTIGDAAQHVAERGLASEGAPVLVKLVEKIAARFGIVVQEKAMLEALPVVGAIGGSVVNTFFMDHFQSKARGHFIVKRLEALHGTDAVRQAYESFSSTA